MDAVDLFCLGQEGRSMCSGYGASVEWPYRKHGCRKLEQSNTY